MVLRAYSISGRALLPLSISSVLLALILDTSPMRLSIGLETNLLMKRATGIKEGCVPMLTR